jgi:HAD superfamily hydrolase (TIGR01509 family)
MMDIIDTSQVKAVILDCGDVILHAPEHKWWPPPFVVETLEKWGIVVDPDDVASIMQKVSRLLDESHHMHTSPEAEAEQFRRYYRYALNELGQASPDDELIEELVRLQSDPEWYIVYDETIPVLAELKKRGYILHMLSNSFLYLTELMKVKGLDEFFDGMTISAQVGCMKPHERIFKVAMKSVGLRPDEMLYVDDIAQYVEKGISLGMQGLVLDRMYTDEIDHIPTISSLTELLGLLPPKE